MYYSNIKKWDIADGAGVRVTLFVSGCTNCCPGCFQPETWDIWCYTGFTLETDLCPGGIRHCGVTDEILGMLDILVDGRFIREKKNLMLNFRGSENQRIIDMPATLREGRTVLSAWND